MDPEKQDDIEWERRLELRCPKCGSANTWPADYLYTDDGLYPIGTTCGDCGHDTEFALYNPESQYNKPFIAPGEPGSHDTLDMYDARGE